MRQVPGKRLGFGREFAKLLWGARLYIFGLSLVILFGAIVFAVFSKGPGEKRTKAPADRELPVSDLGREGEKADRKQADQEESIPSAPYAGSRAGYLNDLASQLSRSLYYSIVTALTIGYGDVAPESERDKPERLGFQIVLYINAVLIGVSGAILTSIVTAAAVEALKKSNAIWGDFQAIERTVNQALQILMQDGFMERAVRYQSHYSFQFGGRETSPAPPGWLQGAAGNREFIHRSIRTADHDKLGELARFLAGRSDLDAHEWRLHLALDEAIVAQSLAEATRLRDIEGNALVTQGLISVFRGQFIEGIQLFDKARAYGGSAAIRGLQKSALANRFSGRFEVSRGLLTEAKGLLQGPKGLAQMFDGELALLSIEFRPQDSVQQLKGLIENLNSDPSGRDLVELKAMHFRLAVAYLALQNFGQAEMEIGRTEKLEADYSQLNWAGNVCLIRAAMLLLQVIRSSNSPSNRENWARILVHLRAALGNYYGIDFVWPLLAVGSLISLALPVAGSPKSKLRQIGGELAGVVRARFPSLDNSASQLSVSDDDTRRQVIALLIAL